MSDIILSEKNRAYPPESYISKIWQAFGSTRKIFNLNLDKTKKIYQLTALIKSGDCDNIDVLEDELEKEKIRITEAAYKKIPEYDYLNEVDSTILQQSRMKESVAWKNYRRQKRDGTLAKKQAQFLDKLNGRPMDDKEQYKFSNLCKPKFKSRKNSKQSFKTTNVKVDFVNNQAYFPSIGWIKMKNPRKLGKAEDISGKTFKYENGQYFVVLHYRKVHVELLPKTGKTVGIDLGIKDVAVTSDGFKSGKVPSINEADIRISRDQRNLHRKVLGSNNRSKARTKLQRSYLKKSNQVKDFLHKLTKKLVSEYDEIFVGDVPSQLGLKNHNLAKSTAESSWHKFKAFLEYKAEIYGKKFEIVDEKYTTQLCSYCGFRFSDISLSTRSWICPECNSKHDRDVNAAINIRTVGSTGIAFGKTNIS